MLECVGEAVFVSDSAASRILALVERTPGAADQLAAAWQVSVADLLARLRADDPVDVDELFDAADVLQVPSAFLAGEAGASRGFAVALRVGAMAQVEAPLAALEVAGRLLEHLQLLDLWQGRAANPLADMDVAASGLFKADGLNTAARVRAVLGLGDGPVGDLVDLVEGLGYPVTHLELPVGLCGLNARDEHDGAVCRVILVNATDPWQRRRFTIAHELAHSLFDDAGQVIVDELEDSSRLEEVRANVFARHFLLPATALRDRFARAQAQGVAADTLVAQVMVEFRVSRDVVVNAIRDDGLVAPDHPALAKLATAKLATLLGPARLVDTWEQLEASTDTATYSPMLSGRARRAYTHGWVHPRVIAEVEQRDIGDVLQDLVEP